MTEVDLWCEYCCSHARIGPHAPERLALGARARRRRAASWGAARSVSSSGLLAGGVPQSARPCSACVRARGWSAGGCRVHTLRKRMMHKSRNHTGRLGVEISTCLRARLRGFVTNELSGHRDGCRATKKSTRAAGQSVLWQTAPMCSVEHVWRAGSSWSSTMQLQPSVWVEWVMLGLGQCSDRW